MIDTLDSHLVAQYLADHPHFFEEHAALLGQVRLASPVTGRAVSLQERQMEVMREKYRVLELRMAELIRNAQDNAAIAAKFHGWTQALLRSGAPAALPDTLVDSLRQSFGVPHATVRLWNLDASHEGNWYSEGVTDDVRIFAGSLLAPYCGSNHDFEAVRWLEEGANVQSTAMLALREGDDTFGLLVLGSPDPERFTSAMGTDFLTHIAETASAALGALRA